MRVFFLKSNTPADYLKKDQEYTLEERTTLYLSRHDAKEAASLLNHDTLIYSGIVKEYVWSPYNEKDLEVMKDHIHPNTYKSIIQEKGYNCIVAQKKSIQKTLGIVYGYHLALIITDAMRNRVVVTKPTKIYIDYRQEKSLGVPVLSAKKAQEEQEVQEITPKSLQDKLVSLMKADANFAAFITAGLRNDDFTFTIDTAEKLYPELGRAISQPEKVGRYLRALGEFEKLSK